MDRYLELSKKYFEKMRKLRREIHMYPEIDRDLPKTCGLVRSELDSLGISYRRYGDLGVIGEIGSGDNMVGLRADMDALKVNDLKGVEYASKNKGYMHACGHDAHTAIQIGAAHILKELEGELEGRVRFIFQPAEETDGGAIDMINYGALEDVKALFGLHVCEAMPSGAIGVKKGVVAAASNPFKVTIKGKGAHGASPQTGIDSILIAAKVIDNLQSIVSREIHATDSVVISIGIIKGGTATNAIASTVEIEGIIRTLGEDLRNKVIERFKEIIEYTTKAFNASADIVIEESYPSYDNNDDLHDFLEDKLKDEPSINYMTLTRPSMGVEDFAYYAKLVPSLYYRLGCRNEERGIVNPAHGSYFDIDEHCLVYGAAVQAMCAVEYLKKIK
ncbi:MAG: amidohydrolase [Clostridium sp.]|uniref:M20 metallopeptidase family protein n=1 Tax=Clostridium sp. TaxID=1506 RepID=UPI002FCAF66B